MSVKFLLFVVFLLIGLHLILLILLYIKQENFIFHPTKLSPTYSFKQFKNFEEHLFITPNDGLINALHFKSQNFPFHGMTQAGALMQCSKMIGEER